jgi:heme oxygenase
MIDYDDNNSYLDFITEKGIKYHIKSTKECRNGYIITFIIKDTVKPVSIQQKLDNDVIKIWEYSEELAESLGIAIEVIQTCFALTLKSKYWLAIDTIEEEIKEYIEVEYGASRISYKEYDRKLNQYEDDDITHTIENIEHMIEKEYGENATLAEIKEDSEYNYNLLIASTYLRTKHKL